MLKPEGCIKHDVCKFAGDSGCLDGCDFRIDGWTSVKDRLPEDRIPVLVHQNGEQEVRFYSYKDKIWATNMGFHDEYSHSITHWMPLPEPPVQKGFIIKED